MINEIKKENLIWIAGFFDGEGNIHLRHSKPTYANPNGQYQLSITIVHTNKDILNNFLTFGGHIYKNYKTKEKHTESYIWRITGLKAKPFLEAILPYLRLKRDVTIIALKFIDTLMSKEYAKKLGLSQELIEQRDILIQEYRKLQPLSAKGRKPKEVEKVKIHNSKLN